MTRKKEVSIRGKLTVGVGGSSRELEIIDFVQAYFLNNRVVSVCSLEDGSIVISVENPPSSGRAAQSNIWLSKESVIGLMTTLFLYFGCKAEDIESLFRKTVENKDMLDFSYSDNLTPKFK